MKEYKETSHNLIDKSLSDLAIYSAGYEECSIGYSYGPKIRSYHVVHFVLSGKGVLHINQQCLSVGEGMYLLFLQGRYRFIRHRTWNHGVMHGSFFLESIQSGMSPS